MTNTLLIRLWGVQLRTANILGRSFHWATSEGRPVAIGLILLGGAIVISEFVSLPHVWLIPTLFLVLLFIFWALKARVSIVIEEFVDHTAGKTSARGAAKVLSIELARMGDVFRVVDERNTLPTSVGEGTPLQAAIKVDALSEVIQNSVTADTKLKILGVEIPIGTGMILLGRIVQGPRLRSQLHEIDNRLVLSAQISGLRHSPTWRLERNIDASEPGGRERTVHGMLPELATRMFTNLGLRRKVKWRAMKFFTKALQIYRSCLRTPRERAVKLLEARRYLVEALAEDEDFVLVYYNLGVIYNELSRMAARAGRADVARRHRDAAEASFEKAVEQDPARWEPYYALARIHYERNQMEQARELCERVIQLPHRRGGQIERAKAHDLIGLTYRGPDPQSRPDPQSLAHEREASKLVLHALRSATLMRRTAGTEDDQLPTVSDLAANCLANLAEDEARGRSGDVEAGRFFRRAYQAQLDRARLRRITTLFRLAQQLTTKDSNLHFKLGLIASDWNSHDLAVQELHTAARIEPERALFWAHLATAHVRRGRYSDKEHAKYAADRAIDVANILTPDGGDNKAVKLVLAVYSCLADEKSCKRLRERRRFSAEISRLELRLKSGETSEAEASIERHVAEGHLWEVGHLNLMLGCYQIEVEKSERNARKAEKRFREAIENLEEHPRDLARWNVYARLARALAMQERRDEALQAAEHAVGLNPLSSFAHSTLGHVFNAADDLESARSAWSDAILWDPNDLDLYWELGFCNWRLARETTDRDKRELALQEAERYLKQASILFPNEQFKDRIRIHYWLGRLYQELGDFDRVIPSLRTVQTSPTMNVVADLLVAEAYRRGRNFNAAQSLLERVIERAKAAIRADGNAAVVGDAEVLDAWPLILVCAEARCALAMSHAERGGDLEAAKAALEHVRRDLGDCDAIAELAASHADRVSELNAHYHHAEGRLHMGRGEVELAIKALGRSIAFQSDAEVYFDLAEAHLMKAAEASEPERRALSLRARSYYTLARATDLRGLCAGLEDLLARIDTSLRQ
jgi:tetratricopeptide (TPR) repeat protein